MLLWDAGGWGGERRHVTSSRMADEGLTSRPFDWCGGQTTVDGFEDGLGCVPGVSRRVRTAGRVRGVAGVRDATQLEARGMEEPRGEGFGGQQQQQRKGLVLGRGGVAGMGRGGTSSAALTSAWCSSSRRAMEAWPVRAAWMRPVRPPCGGGGKRRWLQGEKVRGCTVTII